MSSSIILHCCFCKFYVNLRPVRITENHWLSRVRLTSPPSASIWSPEHSSGFQPHYFSPVYGFMGINPDITYNGVSFPKFCIAENRIIIQFSIAYKSSKVHRDQSLMDPFPQQCSSNSEYNNRCRELFYGDINILSISLPKRLLNVNFALKRII